MLSRAAGDTISRGLGRAAGHVGTGGHRDPYGAGGRRAPAPDGATHRRSGAVAPRVLGPDLIRSYRQLRSGAALCDAVRRVSILPVILLLRLPRVLIILK
jgi:hypothetical protein